jgi:hypothetical protein
MDSLEKKNICKVVSTEWDDVCNRWLIKIDEPKSVSIIKNNFEITLQKSKKRIFIHESAFGFLVLFYPVDENDKYLTNMVWASQNLQKCFFFVESEEDIIKGIYTFYRNLIVMERREELNGYKTEHFLKRIRFSHGLSVDIFS